MYIHNPLLETKLIMYLLKGACKQINLIPVCSYFTSRVCGLNQMRSAKWPIQKIFFEICFQLIQCHSLQEEQKKYNVIHCSTKQPALVKLSITFIPQLII